MSQHNGKKKTSDVVFTSLNNASQIPAIIEQKVSQIPAYEDSGVKYQGKFKTQQNQNSYELRGQTTRFYTLGLGAGAPGSHLLARARPQTKFFCTKMIIEHANPSVISLALGQISIADVKNSVASTKFYYYPFTAAPQLMVLDFTDSPRMFEGDNFDIYTQYGLGAAEFLVISLFGWEEQA